MSHVHMMTVNQLYPTWVQENPCMCIWCILPCSITNLRTELTLVCEERDKLTQELKRTPGLIDKTLADLREQCEHLTTSQHRINAFATRWPRFTLNVLPRREQTAAAAAAAGAELDAGLPGCGW